MRNREFIAEVIAQYPPHTFSYNPETSLFQVDEDDVPLDEYSHYIAIPREPMSVEEAEAFIDEQTLLLGSFDHLLQMPRLTNWLESKDVAGLLELRSAVVDTMIHAFVTTDTDHRFAEKELKNVQNDLMGFSMSMLQPGHPNFTVLGNCACMGHLPQGAILLGEEYWSQGFVEYDLHNIDMPHQRIALFAGAGTLAHFCKMETK